MTTPSTTPTPFTSPTPPSTPPPPNSSEPASVESAPTDTIAVETTAANSEPLAVDCRRLTDFDKPEDAERWVIVNDGVMGGRSAGFVEFADSAMRFSGEVVTAGGGFTSVRLRTIGDELIGTNRIVLRVRSDDRTYSVTFNDAPGTRRRIAHGADISSDGTTDVTTEADGGWSTVEVLYDDLRATVFGQPVDAPAFDPEQVSEIGIIISDGVDGPFALEVDWIDACRSR